MTEEQTALMLKQYSKVIAYIQAIEEPMLSVIMENMIDRVHPFMQPHVLESMTERDFMVIYTDLVAMCKVKNTTDAARIRDQYKNNQSTPSTQKAWKLVNKKV